MTAIMASWAWPQYTMLFMSALTLLIHSCMHGKPREPWNAITYLCALPITYFILIAGGFFG